MADTTVELLLKSIFDSKGLKEAQRSVEQIDQSIDQLRASAREQGPFAGLDFGEVNEDARKLQETFANIGVDISGAFENVKSVEDFKKVLTDLRETAVDVQETAAEEGNLGEIFAGGEAARQVEQLDKRLFGVSGTFQHLGKEADALGRILQSTFNQMGFAIFVTTSTFRNLQMILKGVGEQFQLMNQEARRFVAFSHALQQANMTSREFSEEIDAVSRGLLSSQAIMQASITITRSRNAELQKMLPLIIEAVEAEALLSGNIADVDSNLQSAVDSLVNAEAATIGGTGSLLDYSEAADYMAIAEARKNRELGIGLDETERGAIVLDSFKAAAQNTIDAAADLPTIGENAGKMAQKIDEATSKSRAALGFLLDAFAETIEGSGEKTDEMEEQLTEVPGLLDEWALGFLNLIAPITLVAEVSKDLVGIFTGDADRALMSLFDKLSIPFRVLQTDINVVKGLWEGLFDPDVEFDLMKILSEAGADAEESFGVFRGEFAQTIGIVEDGGDKIKDALEDIADVDFTGVIGALQDILGPERKLQQDIDKVWADAEVQRLASEDKFNEETLRIREDAIDRREQLEEDHADRLNDIAADLSRKWARITEDSEDRLRKIRDDAQDKRENVTKKKAEKIAKIEEDLQKKIDDIMRKFELARLRALIDRDARALFEAEQRKREELAKATEDAKDKREQAKDDAQKELQDINDNEAKKLQQERDAAAKRLRRAQEDAEIRRLETIAQYEEQNAQINEMEEERLADAFARFKKEQERIRKERDKRINDLKEAHEERMMLLKAQALLEEAQRLDALDQTTQQFKDAYADWDKDYKDFYDTYEGRITDTIDLINSLGNAAPGSLPLPTIGGSGGGSSTTTSGGGGGGSGGSQPCADSATISFVPTAGTPCSGVPLERTLIAPDCSRWACSEHPDGAFRWARDRSQINTSGPVGSPIISSSNSTLLGGMQAMGGGQRQNGRLPVTIQVQGDSTLEEIFRSIAFDAFVEVVN